MQELTAQQLREAIDKAKACLVATGATPYRVAVHPGWIPLIEANPEYFLELGVVLQVDARNA